MKTPILAIIFILSLAITGKSLAQSNTDIFTITVYESLDKGYNQIVVMENDQLLEKVQMAPLYYKDLEVHQAEINKVLMKYQAKGFEIVSEIRGEIIVSAASALVTTYRLQKKPN